jgi:DNA-binding FadR family transcriptional regulator
MWPNHTGKVLGRIFTDVPEWPAMREVVTAEHRDILETISNGEGERAATRVHAHIMKSYDWMLLAGGQSD